MKCRVGCTVRGMVMWIAAISVLAALLPLSVACAQDARAGDSPAVLELKREGKPPRPIVRPKSDSSQTMRDAAAAAAEYEQRQRDEALAREQTRQVPRRPDLGYDVTSGIQQRNIPRR